MQQEHRWRAGLSRLGDTQPNAAGERDGPRSNVRNAGGKHLRRREPSPKPRLRVVIAVRQAISMGRPASLAMRPSRKVMSAHRSSPESWVSSGYVGHTCGLALFGLAIPL